LRSLLDFLYEEVRLRRTKGNKPRVMYLTNPEVRAAVKRYLEERRQRHGLRLEQALFLSQKDGGFSANSLQHLFGRLYRLAGIDGASSHSGRRHFATNLIHKGVDLKAVSVLMGHSSVAVTARYVDDNPHRLRKVIAELT
jgi:integrase/recombinase XerD